MLIVVSSSEMAIVDSLSRRRLTPSLAARATNAEADSFLGVTLTVSKKAAWCTVWPAFLSDSARFTAWRYTRPAMERSPSGPW